MKAVMMHEFGGPEVLNYQDVETPEPGPDDVLVKVHAVSVNRTLDLVVRENKYARTPVLPHILGVDPSGVIEAVGSNVTDRKVGERVYCSLFVKSDDPDAMNLPGVGAVMFLGVNVWGGYAEYVKVPAENAQPIPDSLDFYDATVVGRHLATAINQIEGVGQVSEGDWVLVMGASGGLGSAAVQVAKLNGANVIGAAGADARVQAAIDCGADHGVNYRTQDLAEEVARITGGQGAKLVCENIGDPDLFPGAFNSLGRGGKMVTAGAHAGGHVELDLWKLYLFQLQIIGEPREQPGGLARALKMAGEHDIKCLIDQVLPLSAAQEGHRIAGARGGTGKVILDPTLD
ncbi:MAG: zinc-binding dehydrogenase [Alphaproteobacteria bacterium]|nr:zinc-binding dehydrogenase [Alphaproteobacteria bacterium]